MKRRMSAGIVVVGLGVCAGLPATGAAGTRRLGDLSGPWRLFADDSVVGEKVAVTRTYHPFRKHPGNPVLVADRPWEGTTAFVYGTVLPGEKGGGYRMWYHSWADERYYILYAVSEDGVRWVKPELGQVDYRGSMKNNILVHRTREDHNPQVIYTPWESDPQRRYKLINFDYGRTPPKHTVSGYWGAYSPDGIAWTDVEKNPILPDPGDVGCFVWDPHGRRYIGWPKTFTEVRGFRRRCVGVSHTREFERWPASTLVLVPDEFDDRWVEKAGQRTEFYGLSGFAYESMYLGFLWVFRITDGNNDGPIFVELVSSQDGVTWVRQERPRTPVLPLGEGAAWDRGMVFTTNHPLVEGGEIKLYYGGSEVTHAAASGRVGIGLATLRKDGFASLDAGADIGSVTTRKLAGAGGRLRVNYQVRGGWVKVEVLDGEGKVVPGYGRDECHELKGDSVDEAVGWKGGEVIPGGQGAVQIRFILRNASIYSFAVDGASRGR